MDWVDAAMKRAASAKSVAVRQGATDQRQVGTDMASRRHLDRFPVEPEDASRSSRRASRRARPLSREPKRAAQSRNLLCACRRWQKPLPVRTAFSASMAEKLVVMPDTRPIVVEQFRKLAATLHEMQRARRLKVVMVASAVSGEGKTFTAMNLALTLSESFRDSVLLVDADFRRPRMHEHFLCQASTG